MKNKERLENCLRMFAMKVLAKRAITESDISECLKVMDSIIEGKEQ
jgi:hypothetical protein